jgi:HK97 family phage major capsid protein
VDELIRKLLERRAALVKAGKEALAKSAESLAAGGPKEDRAAHDAAADAATADIREIDTQVEKLKAQQAADQRAAGLAVATGGTGDQDGTASGEPRATISSEPTMYGRHSGRSFFLDQARAEIQHDPEAAERLKRHQAELDVELPRRREARAKAASAAVEQLMTRSHREQRAYERFTGQGGKVFEKRAISRTDGQGGYFVPPLWLVDDYIPYLRAGRVFADQWTNLPLPSGTDSINIPRVVLGTATGPQTADGGPTPGRDMTDNFVNALVRTVAGQQDAAIQLLDQSPVAFDQIIFKDLMADYAMNLSGQLIVGSGSNGQLTGLYPQGTITGGSTPGAIVNTVTSTTTTQWTGTSTSFYACMAQLLSKIARTRFRPPTRVVTNPAVWYALASASDTTNRPIVMPAQQGLGYNAAAGDDDGPVSEGPVGHILGVPWILDPNIPLTFGGTVAPSISTISQGNVGPVDGTGGNPDFTPAIAMVADDLYLWEGELRSRTLSEVLSGTLQVRFQVYGYAASMPNRYQNSSSTYLSYGNANSGTTQAGALSTGTSGGLVGF